MTPTRGVNYTYQCIFNSQGITGIFVETLSRIKRHFASYSYWACLSSVKSPWQHFRNTKIHVSTLNHGWDPCILQAYQAALNTSLVSVVLTDIGGSVRGEYLYCHVIAGEAPLLNPGHASRPVIIPNFNVQNFGAGESSFSARIYSAEGCNINTQRPRRGRTWVLAITHLCQ